MISIRKFGEKNSSQWDLFVQNSNNGTLFHLRRFINYHPKDRFEDHSLEFYKNNHLFAVLPAAKVTQNEKTLLISHPGATI